MGAYMKLFTILLLLVVSACGPTLIMLKHPKTGEIVRCAPGAYVDMPVRDTRICAQAYEQNGYERINPK